MDNISAQLAQLQKDVGRHHAAAAALDPGTTGRAKAFDELLTATDALLAYAAQVPDLRQEPARRTTQLFALWTARGAAAVAALTAAAVIPGWVAWGWLLLLLPVLLAAVGAGWKAKPLPKGRPHLRHRTSAVLLAACTLVLSAIATGLLSAWWLTAAVACAGAAFLTGLPDEQRSTK